MTSTEPLLIEGLEEIGRRCGRHKNTVSNWIKYHGFPAGKLPDGRWCTTANLIDKWLSLLNNRPPGSAYEFIEACLSAVPRVRHDSACTSCRYRTDNGRFVQVRTLF